MFKKNMGGVDRGLRIAIGVLLIISAAVGALGSWAYVGVVPIITGLVGNCPAYSIFGIRTCKS
jgi:hypothetical protein